MIKHYIALDFEFYYDKQGCSLTQLSTPEYIFHPKFEVLMLAAWDIERWPVPRIIEATDIPKFLRDYPADETLAIAHNSLFDMAILAWKYGYVPARMADTLGMVRGLKTYKYNSLGAVTEQLFGFNSKGDTVHKVAGMNVQAIKNAGLWPDFKTYALNDVRLCAQIYFKLLPEFPVEERLIMDLVLRCAIQPMLHVDVPMLQIHLDELRRRKQQLLNDCGYEKAELMSTARFQTVLEGLGVKIQTKQSAAGNDVPAFAKSDPFMRELSGYEGADPDTNFKVQTLAAARLAHKSTIEETRTERFIRVAELPWPNEEPMLPIALRYAARQRLLPVALRYGAAITHRLGGEWRMNLQNLPRDNSKSKLRSALLAPPEHKLIAADLSQIEARLVATTSEELELVNAFRKNQDIYADFAKIIFGRAITKKDNPHERFIGKTAILGLGYGCGVDRFYEMVTAQARQNNIPLDAIKFDKTMAQDTVDKYRSTYRKICGAWRKLDRLVQETLLELREPDLRNLADAERRADPKNYIGEVVERKNYIDCSFRPVKIMRGKIELPNSMFLNYGDTSSDNLFGAKCLENICQALARIVIMQTALRLYQKYELRFIMQAHDELVFAVPTSKVEWAKRVIMAEMIVPPAWLPNLPLAAEIGVGDNYGECK